MSLSALIKSPLLVALICVICWSFVPVVAKFGQSGIDNLQFLLWSNLLSTMVVGLVTIRSKVQLTNIVKHTNHKQTFVLGFLGCFFFYVCLYYGYAEGSSTEVLVIQYLWPALTSGLAVVILRESMNRYKSTAILLGFSATMIVLTKGKLSNLVLDDLSVLLIVFIGALSFALFSVLSKKQVSTDISSSVFMFFFWATICSVISVLVWSEFKLPNIGSLWTVFLNGVLINGLSYILWVYALSKVPASKIAPLVYLSPVLSYLWIVFFLDEKLTMLNIVAIILVICSGLLVVLDKENAK